MTATFTSDFRHEFEQEQERWLRRRFLWYSGVVIGLSVLMGGIALAAALFLNDVEGVSVDQSRTGLTQVLIAMVSVLAYVGAFWFVYRNLLRRAKLLTLVVRLIVATGLLSVVSTPIVFEFNRDEIEAQISKAAREGESQTRLSRGISVTSGPEAPGSEEGVAAGEKGEGAVSEDEGTQGLESGASSESESAGSPRTESSPQDEVPAAVSPRDIDKQIARMVVAGNALGSVFMTHFFACLFLPWTWRESIKPMVPLLIAMAMVNLYYVRLVPTGATLSIVLSPLTAVPGALICVWRQSRFKDKFTFQMLKGRYGEIKQELTSAKQIHESLFPKPIAEGKVRLDYRYEPMRMIGGDYLYARVTVVPGLAHPVLNLAIIDVTGHGITAALTVNRLHGEIDRQYGERPGSTPGDILTGLNKYLHHTLATHSVYATALCVQVDPNSSTLTWASAGHPPAFLRTIDGRIDRIESTTFVLGACHGDDFQHGERLLRFGAGDTLIAYTDGAIEARDKDGKMLKVAGMERLLASLVPASEGGWSESILRAVDGHRHGPPEDDTLLVEVWRPLR